MNLSNALKTGRNIITANSPVLLVGTAIVGVVTTGILAAKAGYKARGIVDEFEENEQREATFAEKAQLTWLCYAVPGVTGASTIAATVGVHVIHNKRNAALAGLLAVTTTQLDDVQRKAEELLGTKKSQILRDERAQRSVDKHGDPEAPNREVLVLEGGSELCQDEWGGRYFHSSMRHIDHAFDKVNARIAEDGHASINDLYEELGLPRVTMGDQFGWSGTKIEPRYGNGLFKSGNLTSDGRSVIVFWFSTEPQAGYDQR